MISEKIVLQTLQDMNQISELSAPSLVDQMRLEQPVVMTYLLAAAGESFELEEGQAVFFIGIVVWQIMQKGQPSLSKVSEKLLGQIVQTNEAQLVKLAADPEADLTMANNSSDASYPEPQVLHYIVEALMEPDEEVKFSEEDGGLAFIILKNVLDALIASRISS